VGSRGFTFRRIGQAGAAAIVVAGMIGPAGGLARPGLSAIHKIPPGTNLATVHVSAGDTYELAPGSRYTGTLNVDANRVTVEGHGPGRWAVITRHSSGSDIRISGSRDTVRWLRITGEGYDGKNGYILGVDVTGKDAAITDVRLYGDLYAGVYFEAGATNGVVSRSLIDHCDALNPGDLGSGAFGVLLSGDHNTVERNTFEHQVTASPVYGRDGSGVEVYYGRYNTIRDNKGSDDLAFTELGGAGATGNDYTGNTFAGPGDFLITRGSGDKVDGPVFNTIMKGNRVRGEVVSYDWRRGDGTLLTLTGNTVLMPGKTALWTDGGYVNGGGNVFKGKVIQHHG
jgi:hypothetical protein